MTSPPDSTPPAAGASPYEPWMRRALQIARQESSDERAAGADVSGSDVPVGAVVYDGVGTEVAAGRNERELTGDPTAHAEVVAMRRAAAVTGSWRLPGCTLVATLEPCAMCAGAMVLARVATLAFGAWEPKTGAVGSLWDLVRDQRLPHRLEVYAGVLESECAALVRDFFRS